MQEEVENKTVNLAVKTSKLSATALCKGLQAYMKHRKEKNLSKMNIAEQPAKGKQSVKELIAQGQGVSSIPLADEGLKDFQKIAKKYGVDFAVVKDKNEEPPVYTIFFKAKDTDVITKILQDYSEKQVKRKSVERPSVLEKLKKFKEAVAAIPRKVAEKKKEKVR